MPGGKVQLRLRLVWLRLLSMPGERHVFDPLLAGILNQRERQGVWAGAAKLVDAPAVAAFRSVATCFLDCDSISGCCYIAPNVALWVNYIEGVCGFYSPWD